MGFFYKNLGFFFTTPPPPPPHVAWNMEHNFRTSLLEQRLSYGIGKIVRKCWRELALPGTVIQTVVVQQKNSRLDSFHYRHPRQFFQRVVFYLCKRASLFYQMRVREWFSDTCTAPKGHQITLTCSRSKSSCILEDQIVVHVAILDRTRGSNRLSITNKSFNCLLPQLWAAVKTEIQNSRSTIFTK